MTTGNAVDFFIDRHIRAGDGDRAAFIDPVRAIGYGDLATATSRFAAGLAAAGLPRESRIGLVLQDTIDFPIAFWGALRAGVVPVPVNTLLPPDQIFYILADCRARLVCVSASLAEALGPILADLPEKPAVLVADDAGFAFLSEALGGAVDNVAPVACRDDEVAFFLYSSGSTSAPKGVRHVHSSLRCTAETFGARVLGIGPDDVVFSAAKLFFAYGLGNAMSFPMSVGACAVLTPDRPTPEHVMALMQRHRPSIFCGVPTLFASLLHQAGLGPGAGSDRLRLCTSAGEALPAHVGARWRQITGTDIIDGVGSTEMLHIFLSNRPGAVHYGSSGVAVPGYGLRLVDEAGSDVAPGEQGELLVQGDSAADGYWNQRVKSRQTFRGEWTATGDKFTQDAQGRYHYAGRSDDMFKVSGIWVSPFEVESALTSHEAVLEAAVVAAKDAEDLVKPYAFVVLKPGIGLDAALIAALQAQVKAAIGPWKYPRWIEAVEALPKTATGKIQRFRLRERVPG